MANLWIKRRLEHERRWQACRNCALAEAHYHSESANKKVAMRIFVERGLGASRTLALSIKPELIFDEEAGYAEAYTYCLRDRANKSKVGDIWFQCGGSARTLSVERIDVCGHSNEAAAHNPHPGVGRLLIYLACKYALPTGGETIALVSFSSAAPFYRRMGMYPVSSQASMIDSHGQLGNSLEPRSLRKPWLQEFNKKLKATRSGGLLIARTETVMSNIEAAVQAQWEEREGHSPGLIGQRRKTFSPSPGAR